jgi:PST family polysaccharide transporter
MSVARQAAWALLGVGGQQAVRLVVLIVLARILSPADFGVVAAAQIIVSLAEVFVDFGLGVGLLQAKNVDRLTERSVMTVAVASSGAIAVLIAYFSQPLTSFLGIAEVEAILPWIALSLFLQGATGPIVQLMFREKRFRDVSLAQLFASIFGQAIVSITLAALGWGYWSLVAGILAYCALLLAISQWLRPVWPVLWPDWRRIGPILNFGAGAFAAQLLGKVARRSDNWVAGRFLGAAALGFYSRAYSLMDMANQLPGVVMRRVLIPHFARHAHAEDRKQLAVTQFYVAHVAGAALTLPTAVAAILLAPEIVAILLGPGWEPAAPVLSILGAGIFLRLAYKVSGSVVLAYGRSWRAAYQAAIYAVLVVAGSLFGMRYGLEGIAAAVFVALAWQFWAQTNLALVSIGGSWRGLARALAPVTYATVAGAAAGIAGHAALNGTDNPWVRLFAIGMAIAVPVLIGLWLQRGNPQLASLFAASKGLFRTTAASPGAD